ncbi:MAG: hypothetical protein VXV85_07900, partial [Candidatus Thermoplasmatota archaeon]|nr:hypothetical protein [Candidatus Thermoplasmatota archaeon]
TSVTHQTVQIDLSLDLCLDAVQLNTHRNGVHLVRNLLTSSQRSTQKIKRIRTSILTSRECGWLVLCWCSSVGVVLLKIERYERERERERERELAFERVFTCNLRFVMKKEE